MIPSSYPNAPDQSTAYAVPTPQQHDLNPLYWDGYKTAQATAAQQCPSASEIPDWNVYHAMVISSMPPVGPGDTAQIGANQAVFDLSNWEWVYNPNSGHNKVLN